MKIPFFIVVLCGLLYSCKNESQGERAVTGEEMPEKNLPEAVSETPITITPISHATAVIEWDDIVIYVDPVGGAADFSSHARPDFVLITDIHGDHMDAATLTELQLKDIPIITPQAVKEQLPDSLSAQIIVMNNGEKQDLKGFSIEAIPMYNLREEAKQFHPKDRGNGYVLERNRKRLYLAGDTEDIPEMRALKNIDAALIPMNLPYTMTVEKAAEAVLAFAPKKVYPYHYRGTEGFADVEKFKEIVNAGNKNIEVILEDWYPENPQN